MDAVDRRRAGREDRPRRHAGAGGDAGARGAARAARTPPARPPTCSSKRWSRAAPRDGEPALAACDRLAAERRRPALARPRVPRALRARLLRHLARARGARRRGDRLALCSKTFARAVLRVDGACTRRRRRASSPREGRAARRSTSVALAQPPVDRGAWFAAARGLAASYVGQPRRLGPRGRAALPRRRCIDDDGGGRARRAAPLEPARSEARRARSSRASSRSTRSRW